MPAAVPGLTDTDGHQYEIDARSPSVAILVGGRVDPEESEAILRGERPRVDVLEMAERYPAQLFDFQWLQARADEEWGTRLLVRAFGRLGRLSEALVLRSSFDARHYDAIYATGEDVGLPFALAMRLLPKRLRPRLVMRVEQLHYGRTPLRRHLYRTFTRLAGRGVDTFVCRTHAYVSYLRDELRFDAGVTTFTPEPIDERFFDASQASSERPDCVPREPYVFSAGLELRDYDTLVEAARDLPLQVVIAAGSPWSHNRYEGGGDPPPHNVLMRRFTRWEMRELYAHAEAVVVPLHPSLRACGMNVINEAWQMNCPVIATRTEGLASYIVDGVNGILVAPGSVAALRDAISAVVGKRESFSEMTTRAYMRAREESSLDRYVRLIHDLLVAAPHPT